MQGSFCIRHRDPVRSRGKDVMTDTAALATAASASKAKKGTKKMVDSLVMMWRSRSNRRWLRLMRLLTSPQRTALQPLARVCSSPFLLFF